MTGEVVSPGFLTADDVRAARGHSELLDVEEDNSLPLPRTVDLSLRERSARRGRALDATWFWQDFWRTRPPVDLL